MGHPPTIEFKQAEAIFERIRSALEIDHMHDFVAIEPASESRFFGKTLSEAVGASRREFPDRLAYVFRVGHKAAIHFGMKIR